MAAIIYHEKSRIFHLYNQQISYLMCVLENGHLGQLYYGKRIRDKEDFSYLIEKAPRPMASYIYEGDRTFSLEHLKQKTVEPLKQLTRESWRWKHGHHAAAEESSCEAAVEETDFPCRAVVFDMDGVIFDSEKLVVECWKEIADRHGIVGVEAVCRECFGTNREVSRQKFKAHYGQDFPYDEYKKEIKNYIKEFNCKDEKELENTFNELLCE